MRTRFGSLLGAFGFSMKLSPLGSSIVYLTNIRLRVCLDDKLNSLKLLNGSFLVPIVLNQSI